MPRRKNDTKSKSKRGGGGGGGGRRAKKPARNWLELPSDITANILQRLGAIEILESAQKVCTAWRKICKDPAIWRVIDMRNLGDLHSDLEKMCLHAVDRSEGHLVDINIEYFGTDELLLYIADRSSQLRRLQITCCSGSIYEAWNESFKKLPLLEELGLIFTDIPVEAIEDAGRYCPLLKSFRLNSQGFRHPSIGSDEETMAFADEEVIGIVKSIPQLRHLQLIGNKMTNKGLQEILDTCTHLESLDLRQCFNINLEGSLGKRCSEQIKKLSLPEDSTKDYGFAADDEQEHRMMMSGGGGYTFPDYEGMFLDFYGCYGYSY